MWIVRVLVIVAGLLTGAHEAFAQTPPAPGQQQQAQPPGQPTPPAQATPPVAATPPPPPTLDVDADLKRLVESIERADKDISTAKENEISLGNIRGNVEGIMYESTQIAERLRPRLAEVKGQIEKLGPAPKPDSPPDSPPVAAERARLNALASAIDGAIRTAELIWVRARQQIERITDMRHDLFAQSITQRRPS